MARFHNDDIPIRNWLQISTLASGTGIRPRRTFTHMSRAHMGRIYRATHAGINWFARVFPIGEIRAVPQNDTVSLRKRGASLIARITCPDSGAAVRMSREYDGHYLILLVRFTILIPTRRRGFEFQRLASRRSFYSMSLTPRSSIPLAGAREHISRMPSLRVPAIDVLRGLVMIIMALDHTRDFFTNHSISLVDPSRLSLPYFFTRWITHLCAPTFVFLAGLSSYLQLYSSKSKERLSAYLLSRGIWLLVLQFTVVYVVMIGPPGPAIFQVIGAIGVSMILLSMVMWLPLFAVTAIGTAIIAGHNALDSVHAENVSHLSAFWRLAHERGMIHFHNKPMISVVYPFAPWAGLMMLGYCFGKIWERPSKSRIRWTVSFAVGLLILFAVLRGFHSYGDPNVWKNLGLAKLTLTTFLNVEKYPPSLQFIAITMGISLSLLAWFDWLWTRGRASWARNTAEVYGRVPLAFYIAHLALIHVLAIMVCLLTGHDWHRFTTPLPNGSFIAGTPSGYGFDLPGIYALWVFVILLLYKPMRTYASYKKSHRHLWWLSYF